MCRYPFGSGGNRVWIRLYFPVRTSSATTSRIKSEGAGVLIEAVIVIARSYRRTRWRTTFVLHVAGLKCSHVCHPERSEGPLTRRLDCADNKGHSTCLFDVPRSVRDDMKE